MAQDWDALVESMRRTKEHGHGSSANDAILAAADEIAALREVATGLWWLLDNDVLVRNIREDSKVGWSIRALKLTRKLAEFHEILNPLLRVESCAGKEP